jgi:hypothetical protein
VSYQEYVDDFERAWRYIKSQSDLEESIKGVAEKRGYLDDNPIVGELRKLGIYYASSEKNWEPLRKLSKDLRLFVEKTVKGDDGKDVPIEGRFLLEDRYVFPVRDFEGNIIALIGWYRDVKKYVTTPSKYFRKDFLYFGMETLIEKDRKETLLCEGIFDTLAARSMGYRAVGAMGITVQRGKQMLYPMLGRFGAVADADRQGRLVVKEDRWGIPQGSRYLTWDEFTVDLDDVTVKIKDLDDMLRYFDAESVRGVLDEALNRTTFRKVVKLTI